MRSRLGMWHTKLDPDGFCRDLCFADDGNHDAAVCDMMTCPSPMPRLFSKVLAALTRRAMAKMTASASAYAVALVVVYFAISCAATSSSRSVVGSMAAQVHSPEGPDRTPTDKTSNNNNNNNNTKREQYADVHVAPALSHAPTRVAVRAVARSFGIQFPGEPIENIFVFTLLLGSRDQLRRFRHDICDIKMMMLEEAGVEGQGFPSLNAVISTEIVLGY